MKKYSKNKLKIKRFGIFIGIFLVLVLIVGVVLLTCFCFRKNIEKVIEKNDASVVSDDVAINSSPIIIDNLVVGALYNSRWVSANKYYLKSNLKSNLDIYVYTAQKRAGTYKMEDVYAVNNSIYANTSYINYIDEYFATAQDNNYALNSQFGEVVTTEKDYELVKKALGSLRIYNNTIEIKKVYTGYVDSKTPVRFLVVTSKNKGIFDGVYSAIIASYPNENKARIVQYDYTSDLQNTDEFPIHSIEFFVDLNGDGDSELVTRDITEFSAYYNIFEYENGKFVRVLREEMKTK